MKIYCIFRGPYLQYAVTTKVEANYIIDQKDVESEESHDNQFWHLEETELKGDIGIFAEREANG